jgi:hypothetical protein
MIMTTEEAKALRDKTCPCCNQKIVTEREIDSVISAYRDLRVALNKAVPASNREVHVAATQVMVRLSMLIGSDASISAVMRQAEPKS